MCTLSLTFNELHKVKLGENMRTGSETIYFE